MRTKHWTIAELCAIGTAAIDNAIDCDGLISFEEELAFQLAAPEHRGRLAITEKEVALIRAVWNLEMPLPALSDPPTDQRKKKGQKQEQTTMSGSAAR